MTRATTATGTDTGLGLRRHPPRLGRDPDLLNALKLFQ